MRVACVGEPAPHRERLEAVLKRALAGALPMAVRAKEEHHVCSSCQSDRAQFRPTIVINVVTCDILRSSCNESLNLYKNVKHEEFALLLHVVQPMPYGFNMVGLMFALVVMQA